MLFIASPPYFPCLRLGSVESSLRSEAKGSLPKHVQWLPTAYAGKGQTLILIFKTLAILLSLDLWPHFFHFLHVITKVHSRKNYELCYLLNAGPYSRLGIKQTKTKTETNKETKTKQCLYLP